jgi:hypothetical protein
MQNYQNYTPKHFKVQELVPSEVFKIFGNGSLFLLDSRILFFIDSLREYYNKSITINNWHDSGSFQNRGFRTPNTTTGGYYSQHRHGRAFDLDVLGVPAEEVRQFIIKQYNNIKYSFLKYITCIELDVNWVHIDNRSVDTSKGVLKIKP